jgi:hypothetical protein
MKISCINCGDPVNMRIEEIRGKPLIRFEILCQHCEERYERLTPDRCVDCGRKVKGLCQACRDKRIEKARAEGKCVMCFVEPVANNIVDEKTSEQTDMCEKCLVMDQQFCKIGRINNSFVKKVRRDVNGI